MELNSFYYALSFAIIAVGFVCGYEVPKARIQVFYPNGFEASIPDEEGITLFTFHGKLNAEMDGLEAGIWARGIIEKKKGRWTFTDHVTKLNLGDTLYYWTNVFYNGLGYHERNGVYIITEYTPHKTVNTVPVPPPTITPKSTSVCQRSITVIKGGVPQRCAGQLIFEDNFSGNTLDSKKWKLERRFPTEPDYEYNIYVEDAPEALEVSGSVVKLKPKPTNRHFTELRYKLWSELNLGANCTGKIDSEECFYENGIWKFFLPPFVTAQFSTKGSFSFKYGRVEIRAKLPQADWVVPQLWLQPVAHKYGSENYQSGQMRIAFSRTNGSDIQLYGGVLINARKPWRSELICSKPSVSGDSRTNWGDDFHVYTLTWTDEYIALAVDNDEYCRIPSNDFDKPLYDFTKYKPPNYPFLARGTRLAPFDQEFYITIGYSIGGHRDFDNAYYWHVPKPWSNTSPSEHGGTWVSVEKHMEQWLSNGDMKVDYVKVFTV